MASARRAWTSSARSSSLRFIDQVRLTPRPPPEGDHRVICFLGRVVSLSGDGYAEAGPPGVSEGKDKVAILVGAGEGDADVAVGSGVDVEELGPELSGLEGCWARDRRVDLLDVSTLLLDQLDDGGSLHWIGSSSPGMIAGTRGSGGCHIPCSAMC